LAAEVFYAGGAAPVEVPQCLPKPIATLDPAALPGHIPDEMTCPVRQLTDDRWVWLPTVLSGRVFTHRVGPD
jgi:hypothetical protein